VVGSRAVEAKQQKTVLGVVLLLLFGGLACCGLTVAFGAYSAYTEAKTGDELRKIDLALQFLDAGAQLDEPPSESPADDADSAPEPTAELPPLVDLPDDWASVEGKLAVSVRPRIVVEVANIRGQTPVHHPLTDDLVEVLVYTGVEPAAVVTDDDLDAWGQSADALFQASRQQLAAASQKPFTTLAPGLYESNFGDGNDVARVLVPEVLKKLKVKGDPIVFLPTAGHVVVAGANDPRALEAAGERVDEHLRGEHPFTGRGWRLKGATFEPWEPPADSLLATLHLEATAQDANDQKKALDAKFAADGTDLFVGTTLFTDDDAGGKHTYAVWTKDADTLMPRAEYIVFVDLDQPEADRVVAAGLWSDIAPKVAAKMKPDSNYWPLRYRLTSFPDKKVIKAIGLHPFFARNKE